MKSTLKILKFSYPYFSLIILNTIFNFLSVVFSLFSISLIIPILGLLFGTIEETSTPVSELSINNFKNYFYAHIHSLIDRNGVISALGFICVLITVGTILKNTTRYLALYFLTPIRNNVIRDIRKEMNFKMLNLPLRFINNFKKGDLVARMTNDLTEIEWSVMGVLEFFIKDPIHITLFLISLIYISPELTLISFVFLPITAFIITKISKSLKKSSLLSQNKIGDLISLIEENISNLKIIKAFNNYKNTSERFSMDNENLKNINNKVLWRKDLASPMSEMLSTLVMVIIIWFGGQIVLTSHLTADAFIGFLVIFSQILPPAKSLTTAFYSIQKGSAAAERILTILETENESHKSLLALKRFSDNIRFKNVSFKYTSEINLQNINLAITKGEMIAIVGESGGGKSTLVELLLKFHSISSGEITIDGQNINNFKTDTFRSLFGLVTQDIMLFNDTVLNNIRVGKNNATREEAEDAAKTAHIHKVIQNLENGYDTIIGDQGGNLSGGERQRISIARAILSNTPILIFDEATSSLDSESHNYIQEALKILNQTKTLIIITHKLKSIEHADNIIVLKNGKIVEEGKHQILLNKNGVYQKLYEIETLKSNEKN